MAAKLLSISPQFLVADVQRAAQWYRDTLGFRITPFFGDPPSFAIVRRDGVAIQLQHVEGGRGISNRSRQGESLDAYIQVQEVDALYRQLLAQRVRMTGAPLVQPWGMKEVYLQDLDGYWLALGEESPPDRAAAP